MEENQQSKTPQLGEYVYAYRISAMIHVATELNIADLLQDGPKDSHYLAVKTATHEPSLYRFLRALTAIDLFQESENGFELTDLSRFLLSDHPDSFQAVIHFACGELSWRTWGELLHVVKTGQPSFEKAFGMPKFDYFKTHPQAGKTFNTAMDTLTVYCIKDILAHYDFSETECIVDIGGGVGRLLFSILEKYPETHGILHDLPHVVREAYPLRDQFGVEDRCQIIEGQFFESVPQGGDMYLLKWILHSWRDEQALQILQNCAQAMNDTAKIVIFEGLIHDDFKSPDGKMFDVHLMAFYPEGKLRTQAEFSQLFQEAGLRLTRTVPLGDNLYAIEGTRS